MSDTLLPVPPAPDVPPVPGTPVAVLGAARDAVGDLGEVLWAAKPTGELVAAVTACERLRSALDAVELQVIAEVAASNAAASLGWASAKDFVTAVTGGTKGAGRRLVALARALTTDRAATGTALAAGEISRTQAEVIVAAVDRLPVNPGLRKAVEQALIVDAAGYDASDLATRAAGAVERLDPDGSERRDERALERQERSAHLGRHLSLTEDGIGGIRVRGRGTIEDAAWIKNALFPLAAPQPTGLPGDCGGTPGSATSCGVADCAHDGRDPREHGTRMWDALVQACQRLAETEALPDCHGAKPRISVLIPFEKLTTVFGTGYHTPHDAPGDTPGDTPGDASGDGVSVDTGMLDTGEPLSAAAVRRLACDAEILPFVLGSKSQILDVGRASRLVTAAIWLALVLRDRHCSFPGCTRPPIACDAHHIVHWADGGSTALDNLVLLCRTHHTMVHSTPWEVRLNPVDRRPEFLPPERLDPDRRPRRRQPLRT